jgi:hypothetical protein
MPISTSSLFREPLIQQPLIRTVETTIPVPNPQSIRSFSVSSGFHQPHHAIKILLPRSEDHHPRIEAVWPSNIRRRVKVFWEVEEVRDGTQRQDIGIEVDDFPEVFLETEDVELGECRMQIGSSWKERVNPISHVVKCTYPSS